MITKLFTLGTAVLSSIFAIPQENTQATRKDQAYTPCNAENTTQEITLSSYAEETLQNGTTWIRQKYQKTTQNGYYQITSYANNNINDTYRIDYIVDTIIQITPYGNATNIVANLPMIWNYSQAQPIQNVDVELYSVIKITQEDISKYLNQSSVEYKDYTTKIQGTQNRTIDRTDYAYELEEQASFESMNWNIQNNSIQIQNKKPTYIYFRTEMYIYRENEVPFETNQINNLMASQFNITIQPINITIDITPIAETYEVIDIKGLMFNVLSMPFAFISQAFNLTLFEGTEYALNISQLFIGIISISLLLWILKLILGKASIGEWLGSEKNAYERKRTQKRSYDREQKGKEKIVKND